MNIVLPQGSKIWESAKAFFQGLGVIPTVVILVIVAAILLFAGTSIWNSAESWNANRKVEALQQQADQWKQKAEAAEAEKNQYQGAAAAYKEQSDKIQTELTELSNVRPELQKQTTAASKRVEVIRSSPLRDVSADMRSRVSELAAKLDASYPDK